MNLNTAILYRDKNWLIVNKPTDISTHGAFVGDLSMQEWISLHWQIPTFVCSRLDKGTSGVLLFALSKEASAQAQQIHEQELSEKVYLFFSHIDCLKIGLTQSFTCEDPLDKLKAKTTFTRVRQYGAYYLYQAIINRGRKHQIRRHAAFLKIPILGDNLYGGLPAARIFLHCARLSWPGIDYCIEAPEPPSFAAIRTKEVFADYHIAFDRRQNLLSSITDAFRLMHRGEFEKLDIAIDKYGEYFCVWNFCDNISQTSLMTILTPLLKEIMAHYNLLGGVIKNINKNPHHKGLAIPVQIFGKAPPEIFTINEHQFNYEINLLSSQHTGLFLDQRDNRRWIYILAQEKTVANLFAFTGSFSVVALGGGATTCFSVDISKKILRWCNKNLELNNLIDNGKSKFAAEDVRIWLQRQLRKKNLSNSVNQEISLIICDPPTFATSTQMGEFSVEKSWNELAHNCAELLSADGIALFSTNFKQGHKDYFKEILQNHFEVVIERSPPIDFPTVNKHNAHVKHFLVAKNKLLTPRLF